MKRIALILISILIVSISANAQKDTSDLNTVITSNFPDNVAGFITPERLRNVAVDLMRSNANKLEDNLMTGKLQVNDSVKTLDAFYTWSGSAWVEVGSDPSVWSRSGGFILPSTYADKLSVDSARIGGVLYPNNATVNVGTSAVPFDTVFANKLIGVTYNSLDEAYDEGRTITADNGAVKIEGADGLLVTGTYGSGAATEISGGGTRMFFNPAKAAFRAGNISSVQWNDSYIGDYSTAVGKSTIASSDASFASGMSSGATGYVSTAMGYNSVATGDFSTSIGDYTTAYSAHELTVGRWNTSYAGDVTNWVATDRLFTIGNGTASGSRSDALIVLKNGNTTLNGAISIVDGTEAAGYVLTSDASGHGTWESPTVRQASITIPTAEVLTLNSIPVEIVPAPGAGYAIEVLSASVKMVYNSTAYATNVILQIENAGATYPTDKLQCLDATVSMFKQLSSLSTSTVSNTQMLENAALNVTVSGGEPTTGNSDIKVYVTYRIMTL